MKVSWSRIHLFAPPLPSYRLVTELNWIRGGFYCQKVTWAVTHLPTLSSLSVCCCSGHPQLSALRCEYRWWKHSSPSCSVSKREVSEVCGVREQPLPCDLHILLRWPWPCSVHTFLYLQPTIHTFGSRGSVSTLSGASRWCMRFFFKKCISIIMLKK